MLTSTLYRARASTGNGSTSGIHAGNFTPQGNFAFNFQSPHASTAPTASGSGTGPSTKRTRNGFAAPASGESTSSDDDDDDDDYSSDENGRDGTDDSGDDDHVMSEEKPDADLTEPERVARANEKKELGNVAYKRADYPTATRFYTHAHSLDPTNPALLLNRAAARMGSKLFSAALEDCLAAHALQLNDPQVKTLVRTAKCQLAVGLVYPALQSLHEAFRLDPANRATAQEKARAERVAAHVDNIQRARERKDWSMVILGVDAAARDAEASVTPKEWRVWKLEALIGKKRFDDAASLAA